VRPSLLFQLTEVRPSTRDELK